MRTKQAKKQKGFGLSDLVFILALVLGFYVVIGSVAASLYTRAVVRRVAEMQAVLDGAMAKAAENCPTTAEGDVTVKIFDRSAQAHYTCQQVKGNLWHVTLSLTYQGLTVSREAYRLVSGS